MAAIVVVFDFDKTIIDTDSDNWVVDELGATDLYNQLLPTMPFNTLMDTMMNELHARGKTIKDIVEVLKRVPIHPRILQAIKSAHALGCDLRIVSDANTFFIETILSHLRIRECFSEINTNPGIWDDEGRLRIFPFHDFHLSSHGCERCPPNMCKGLIIEKIQASLVKDGKKRMIYLGDGSNDFCPSLKLQESDFMLPRKDFPVWELICQNRSLLKSEVHEWSNGVDFESLLIQVIDLMLCEENSRNGIMTLLPSEEFKKLERFPMAAPHEVFPQVLSKLLTTVLSELGLNIEEVHAFSTTDGFSLEVFVVHGWPYEETEMLKDEIQNEILKIKC